MYGCTIHYDIELLLAQRSQGSISSSLAHCSTAKVGSCSDILQGVGSIVNLYRPIIIGVSKINGVPSGSAVQTLTYPLYLRKEGSFNNIEFAFLGHHNRKV